MKVINLSTREITPSELSKYVAEKTHKIVCQLSKKVGQKYVTSVKDHFYVDQGVPECSNW